MSEINPIGSGTPSAGAPTASSDVAGPTDVEDISGDDAKVGDKSDEEKRAEGTDSAAEQLERMYLAHQALTRTDNPPAAADDADNSATAIGAAADTHSWTADNATDASTWSFDDKMGGAADTASTDADWTYTNAFGPTGSDAGAAPVPEGADSSAVRAADVKPSNQDYGYDPSSDDARDDKTNVP